MPFALESILIRPETTFGEAMACIDRGAKGIALVVDGGRRLIATLTDGDFRRAILAGHGVETPVSALLAKKSATPYPQPITAQVASLPAERLQRMREASVRQLPLLDREGCVVDLVTLDDLVPAEGLALRAVIMAGGFGKRLQPLTDDTPKPMLPLGDQPLMELIVGQLRHAGIHHVKVTTHHHPEKIIDHFGDGSRFGVDISYVNEDQPLGTAGALGLMRKPDEPLLVMNGDILTRVDFRAMLAFHREQNAELTVGVRQYDLQVPYGVIECDGPNVLTVREKPSLKFLVNAGIYLLEPAAHGFIPTDRRFDMTDLIQCLLEHGRRVVSFPIIEYWLDVGRLADYERAQQDVEDGRFAS